MPTVSRETAESLVRIAFVVGAVTDGLAVVPMLSLRVGVALFGGDRAMPTRKDYRYAMGLAASLVAGWTVLLAWGALRPLERRDLLLLTLFPTVTGIVAATVYAARHRFLAPARLVPLWVHLGAVGVFYVAAYVLSAPFAVG